MWIKVMLGKFFLTQDEPAILRVEVDDFDVEQKVLKRCLLSFSVFTAYWADEDGIWERIL